MRPTRFLGGVALAAAIVLCSCSMFDENELSWNDPEYGRQKNVTLQICLPNREAFFEVITVDLRGTPKSESFMEQRKSSGFRESDMYKSGYWPKATQPTQIQGDQDEARRWLPNVGTHPYPRHWLGFSEDLERNGRLSESADSIYLASSTVKNQPIFEKETSHRKNDILAISTRALVSTDGEKKEWIQFWFKLPKRIPTAEFSPWFMPVAQEDNIGNRTPSKNNAYRLMRGADIITSPVDGNAPRMRAMELTQQDTYDRSRYWWRVQQAINESKLRERYPKELADRTLSFVPKATESIPACD